MNIDIKLHKNDLPDDVNLGNLIAVDGEFMGLNVKRDPLCLIQISTGNLDAHIVQLDRTTYNAPNLIKALSDQSIAKIFHYGRADIAHIKYYLKTDTNNIFEMFLTELIIFFLHYVDCTDKTNEELKLLLINKNNIEYSIYFSLLANKFSDKKDKP